MFLGAAVFTLFYFFYILSLTVLFPDYVGEVWNLAALSGISVFGIPAEELLFALGMGLLWSGVYEHIKWRKIV